MLKFLFKSILWLTVILTVGVLGRHQLATWATQGALRQLTDSPNSIDHLRIDLLQPRVIAQDIVIRNPKGAYQEAVAAKISSMEADYDIRSLLNRQPRIRKLTLEVYEVNVVRNPLGEVNLQTIEQSSTSGIACTLRVDELILSMQNVRYFDEQQNAAAPLGFKAHIYHQRFTDIPNATELKKLICHLASQSLPSKFHAEKK